MDDDHAKEETYLSLEQMLVVVHSIPVCERSDFILQHLLVDAEVSVRVKVVVP